MADTGQVVTYGALVAAAYQGAQLFRSLGLGRGEHIAILLENHPRFLQLCWAAQCAGLYYTAINWRLQPVEIERVLENCEAKVLVTSYARRAIVGLLPNKMTNVIQYYMMDGVIHGFEAWEDAIDAMPDVPVEDFGEGAAMLYSAGTTGTPKGIKKLLPETSRGEGETARALNELYGAHEHSIYLSAAPLYHSAELEFTMACLGQGTEVVVMEQFEPELALRCIEQYSVTHSQWAPTMFVRMLELPEDVRGRYDVSSLRYAIHSAAPCPIPIKEQMIDWWGEVLYEYYAGTEDNGFIQLNSQEWLAHKGSVGRPVSCELHICNDDGDELPAGEMGAIYMSGGGEFEYCKDIEQTRSSRNSQGWSTLGDVGYLDAEGYLFLTDRKHFMITTGGLRVCPQEAENVLITHDEVIDVAVFGVANVALAEEVKAVVQPRAMATATPELALELMDYCRSQLSQIKCPSSIDFRQQLPRHPTGKLYKQLLRDEYRQRVCDGQGRPSLTK